MERCLKKQCVVNEDRISELPEALLLQILSLLPTEEIIATSVLSKGWRSLWKMVPRLVLVSLNKFSENVTRSLLSHKAPVLESLRLKLTRERIVNKKSYNGDIGDFGDIGAWLGIAFARHVRELELHVCFSFGGTVPFPSSLFSSASLETLILKQSIEVDVPSPISMKSLKTLHLLDVSYKNPESFCNLLSGCPNLEVLHLLKHCHRVMIETIVAPSLKRLFIYDYTIERKDGGYVINAPSLTYLHIEEIKGYKFCRIENASELVEAKIINISEIGNEMILESLKSCKRLSLELSPWEIKCPTRRIFYQLVYLEMSTHKGEWWRLLARMLDSSPKLQVLKLTGCMCLSRQQHLHCLVGAKWSKPNYVPECLLSQLETFVWTRYDWRREEEKEVAIYILRNAKQLKKATFSIGPIEKLNELEERRGMLEELNGVVKASNSCNLAVEFE